MLELLKLEKLEQLCGAAKVRYEEFEQMKMLRLLNNANSKTSARSVLQEDPAGYLVAFDGVYITSQKIAEVFAYKSHALAKNTLRMMVNHVYVENAFQTARRKDFIKENFRQILNVRDAKGNYEDVYVVSILGFNYLAQRNRTIIEGLEVNLAKVRSDFIKLSYFEYSGSSEEEMFEFFDACSLLLEDDSDRVHESYSIVKPEIDIPLPDCSCTFSVKERNSLKALGLLELDVAALACEIGKALQVLVPGIFIEPSRQLFKDGFVAALIDQLIFDDGKWRFKRLKQPQRVELINYCVESYIVGKAQQINASMQILHQPPLEFDFKRYSANPPDWSQDYLDNPKEFLKNWY